MMKKHMLLAAVTSLFAMSAQAADMNKVLRVAFNVPETGFDPAKVFDLYSRIVTSHIFENLYNFDGEAGFAAVHG